MATRDRIAAILNGAGILASGDCLVCDVCCRFPNPDTALAPYFANAEIRQARADLPEGSFPPGEYGPGSSVGLTPHGSGYRCPAFRPAANDCALYDRRPLDCRLYPFMLMYDRLGSEVLLGLDTYCPVLQRRTGDARFTVCWKELAEALEGPLHEEVVAARGIVGTWAEHITPLAPLPRLTRRLCRSDLGLRRFTLSALPALTPFFESHRGRLSMQIAASLDVWRDVFDLYWTTSGRRLIVLAEGDGDILSLTGPLGEGDAAQPALDADRLMRAALPRAASPRLQDVDDADRDALVAAGWRVRESSSDYVYLRSDMADLKGNRFAKKRVLCHRLERSGRRVWRSYQPEDLPAVMGLHRRWMLDLCARHTDVFSTAQAEVSARCVYRGLRDADVLGLTARVLEVEGRIAGFTAGAPLHDGESFFILFEFSDRAVSGAAQFMFREFCRELTGFTWINAGGDSGLPALRRVKESYRPALLHGCHVMERMSHLS